MKFETVSWCSWAVRLSNLPMYKVTNDIPVPGRGWFQSKLAAPTRRTVDWLVRPGNEDIVPYPV